MKVLATSIFSLLSLTVFAQTEITAVSSIQSQATIRMAKSTKRCKYFSASAPVTMADGSMKSIADVRVGEHVKTCKDGKTASTQVKQIDVFNQPTSLLTAVYLRPVDDNASSDSPIVPALLLEATPNHKVQTNRGRKRMKRLSKNDILYHYEPSTGIVSSWKVGAVQENARRVNKAYNLETVDGTYLVDNVMVSNN
ncbi:Hint domain-containing protein [Dyadobacter sp. CY261]|uniref:Hint domain-containing protein n=1 Tax=Dyadobacter sp. CY261 TaxID=2907203 RepID=UPI001F1E12B2|nr:Hint domain-containing protein [Dyadobacter sp. CY261]MCF0070514.1 Hint domain-containing protein [Dyadobacter sp. CY261]